MYGEQEMYAIFSCELSQQETASEAGSKWETCIMKCMEELCCENMNSTGQSRAVAVFNVGRYLEVV